jgi:hypothetical protein
MNLSSVLAVARAIYGVIRFVLFSAEETGLDEERRRKKGRRKGSGGIIIMNLIFAENL